MCIYICIYIYVYIYVYVWEGAAIAAPSGTLPHANKPRCLHEEKHTVLENAHLAQAKHSFSKEANGWFYAFVENEHPASMRHSFSKEVNQSMLILLWICTNVRHSATRQRWTLNWARRTLGLNHSNAGRWIIQTLGVESFKHWDHSNAWCWTAQIIKHWTSNHSNDGVESFKHCAYSNTEHCIESFNAERSTIQTLGVESPSKRWALNHSNTGCWSMNKR